MAVTSSKLPFVFQAIEEFLSTAGMGAARMHFDFAVDGGAIGPITPKATAFIPAGAVILGGFFLGASDVLSAGAATIAIDVGADSLLAAMAIAAMQAGDLNVVIPTFAVPVVAAGGLITATVAAFDLTAGVFDVLVFYALVS